MKLEILVGMIASGKSTYARMRAGQGAVIVSHDGLTTMLHGEYRFERLLRQVYRDMEEDIARQALLAKLDVVIDRTHQTREARERWTKFAQRLFSPPRPRPELVAVVFPIAGAEEHARRRHEHDARGREYEAWLQVATRHRAEFLAEPIDWRREGFDRLACQPFAAMEAAARDA